MLRIHTVCLEMVRDVAALADVVEKRDRDLARQVRRSSASIVLNLAEGYGSQGGNKKLRYRNALGSARETLASLQVAEAVGYVTLPHEVLDRIDHVTATLVNLVY